MSLNFDVQLQRFEELERLMSDPDIASNPDRYRQLAREHGSLSKVAYRVRRMKQLEKEIEENKRLLDDKELGEMAQDELSRLEPELSEIKDDLTDMLLASPEENLDSLIMEIRAGTGGEEASLFARDLFEMYKAYAESKRWKVEVLEFSVSETRGFKEIIFSITGEGCYRELQFESGGHRVQRVPETETQGRVHTSAATVAVLAEPEEVDIEIRPEDIEMEATRSSGPGGQHVNKTSSAVRITHLPSGLVVFCQEERSQHKNRAKAMRMLRSRLYDQTIRKQQAERAQTRRSLIGSGDRSERIRTYNFPQNRCTDHRINVNMNLQEIIAGNLSKLIASLREFDRNQRLSQATTGG
jgi:peptide chain release factor 1